VNIQRELNRLEEIVLDSPRIPLSRRTLIDEEQVLEQLDLVRLSLPEALHVAEDIVRHRDELLVQSEQYAQDIIEQAEQRAAQILNEMGILRQAELEADQIRQRVQSECEAARDQTIADIDRMRQQAQQELEAMHRQTVGECEGIQMGADDYADRVLGDMEAKLAEMLRVIRNGRGQLGASGTEPSRPEPAQRSHGGGRPSQGQRQR
jgi:ATP-dependent Clp protease ATP-binding subunit ClpA